MTSDDNRFGDFDHGYSDVPGEEAHVVQADDIRIAPLRALTPDGVTDMVVLDFGAFHDDHTDGLGSFIITRALAEDLILLFQEGFKRLDAGELDELNTAIQYEVE